ncbi:hypothetical protein GCM10027175_08790 [Hymenobacter latericoloratus]
MALVVWLALWSLLMGTAFIWKPTLDIQLHNTYFVVGSYLGQLISFLLILFLVLLLDAGRRWAASNATVALACGLGSPLLLCWCVRLGYAYSTLSGTEEAVFPLGAAVSGLLKLIWTVSAFLFVVVIWAGITCWRLRAPRAR